MPDLFVWIGLIILGAELPAILLTRKSSTRKGIRARNVFFYSVTINDIECTTKNKIYIKTDHLLIVLNECIWRINLYLF